MNLLLFCCQRGRVIERKKSKIVSVPAVSHRYYASCGIQLQLFTRSKFIYQWRFQNLTLEGEGRGLCQRGRGGGKSSKV